MAYTNTYTRINWQNLPSEATALNDVNLNKMDAEIYNHGEEFEVVDTAITNINSSLNGKVDKEAGKGLSAVKSITISPSVNTGTKIAEISYKNQDNLTIGYEIKNGVVVDSALSSSSENPVQNKVVKSAIDAKSTVSISDTLVTGDTIANLTINGTTTAIKAPLVEVDDTPSATSENPLQNKAIYEMLNEILPEETAEGNPISINDASGLNAKACSVDLLPIQDLHGYDSPWVGGAGKNKLNATGTIENCTLSDGIYTLNSVPSSNANFIVGTIHLGIGDYKINGGYDNSFRININVGGTYYTSKGDDVAFSITTEGDFTVSCIILTSATAGKQIKPMIRLSSVTDATFAPYENICPISGRTEVSVVRTGKNLIDTIEQGALNESGAETSNNNRTRTEFIMVKGGTTYTSTVGSGLVNSVVQYYTSEKTNISRVTNGTEGLFSFTTPTNAEYVRLVYRRTNASDALTPEDTKNAMLELGSTPTPYEPPVTPETYTETLGQTVYGGTLDLTSGKLTIDREFIEATEVRSVNISNNIYYWQIVNGIDSFNALGENKLISNIFVGGSFSLGKTYITANGKTLIAVPYDQTLNTKALADAWCATNKPQFCYKIATPIELTLTPEEISLLKGNNVISTDGDNIILKYSADIKAWVENQLQS